MCEAVCGTWAAGMPDDDMGNTVGCHQYHAEASAGDGADMHCAHAGPTGDGFCGDLCENFCELAGEVCADTFADNATCMTECEAFDDMPTYSGATVSGDLSRRLAIQEASPLACIPRPPRPQACGYAPCEPARWRRRRAAR